MHAAWDVGRYAIVDTGLEVSRSSGYRFTLDDADAWLTTRAVASY